MLQIGRDRFQSRNAVEKRESVNTRCRVGQELNRWRQARKKRVNVRVHAQKVTAGFFARLFLFLRVPSLSTGF